MLIVTFGYRTKSFHPLTAVLVIEFASSVCGDPPLSEYRPISRFPEAVCTLSPAL